MSIKIQNKMDSDKRIILSPNQNFSYLLKKGTLVRA